MTLMTFSPFLYYFQDTDIFVKYLNIYWMNYSYIQHGHFCSPYQILFIIKYCDYRDKNMVYIVCS